MDQTDHSFPFNLVNFEEYSQWQAAILQGLESLEALTIILVLVIFITIYTLYEVIYHSQSSPFFRVIDLIVSSIFIAELVLRIYCSAIVHKGLTIFFSSSLNILDIFVVFLDVILLSIGTQIGQAVSFAKYAPPEFISPPIYFPFSFLS